MPDILLLILYRRRYVLYLSSLQLTSLSNFLQLLLFHLTCLLEGFSENALFGTVLCTLNYGLLVALVLFIKLQTMEDFIRHRLKVGWLTEAHFARFLGENTLILRILADVNTVFGNILYGFLLLNTPVNATLLMMIALGSTKLVTHEMRVVLGSIFSGQICLILLLSGYSIAISSKLHAPSRGLLVFPVKSLNRWSLKAKLKLTRYLEQFHTVNLYTVNLGQFGGKITYQSTGRHLFFYVKFLIFAYKLLAR